MSPERYPYSSTREPVPYLKYGVMFALVYMGVIIVIGAISLMFGFDTPSFMSIVMSMLGGMIIGFRFYKDHKRLPEKSERRRLALCGLLGGLVVSGLSVLALVAFQDIALEPLLALIQTPTGLVIMVFASVFTCGLTYLAIGFGVKQGAEVQQKADAKSR